MLKATHTEAGYRGMKRAGSLPIVVSLHATIACFRMGCLKHATMKDYTATLLRPLLACQLLHLHDSSFARLDTENTSCSATADPISPRTTNREGQCGWDGYEAQAFSAGRSWSSSLSLVLVGYPRTAFVHHSSGYLDSRRTDDKVGNSELTIACYHLAFLGSDS